MCQQLALDSIKKVSASAALASSFLFCKSCFHVVVGCQAIIETLNEKGGPFRFDLARLNEMQAKHTPHGKMAFGSYVVHVQRGLGAMEYSVVRARNCIGIQAVPG